MSRSARPLIPAAISFALGIGAGPELGARLGAWGVALLLLGVAGAIVAGIARGQRRTWLLLPLLYFGAGLAAVVLRATPVEDIRRAAPAATREGAVLEGLLLRAPRDVTGGLALTLEVDAAGDRADAPLSPARGRVEIVARGAPASRCAPGDRVRIIARLFEPLPALLPGGPSAQDAAARRGVALRGRAALPCVVLTPNAGGPRFWPERVRARLHRAIDEALPADSAAIVRAFATGDTSGIDPRTQESFRAAGLSHLLAVSGLNVALTVGTAFLALSMLLRRSERIALHFGAARLAALLALPTAVAYALVVGATPSAVRATVMMSFLLGGVVLQRRADAWNTLAIAVLALLAWDPASLDDPALQLSVAAVASLLAFERPLRDRLGSGWAQRPRWQRWPLEVLLASAAATLGTAPILAVQFQRLSLIGILANVPAAPLASLVLVPLSAIGAALALIAPLAGRPLLVLARWAAELLREVAEHAASLPFAEIRVPPPTWIECGLFYALIIAWLLRSPSNQARRASAVLAALLLASLASHPCARWLRDDLEVAVLPVGQGDAILAELPGGATILIDTGPGAEGGASAAERVIAPYLRRRWIRRIDLLILTHPHADHTGGLASIARELELGRVWWNGDRREADPSFLALIDTLGARVVTATTAPITLGGARLAVLAPVGRATAYNQVNDGSIVVSLQLGERRFLFAGDAEAASEVAMIAASPDALAADVLKLGHHGSKSSSGESFLERVRPSHAVSSVGAGNRFGFPHRPVLARLDRLGVTHWRTDTQGLIRFVTDGRALEVRSFR
ncbi:MAG: DNA internalization-related competence protein ComEC/Rec2 [Deltaproteobacteria bacterium]|nr:DNA internalization-related competence protein ComEC/Rec2 [Deltaproteobacteria bacterium]